MKIAVLLTGQPRCVQEGSWWWHNKCSPIGEHYHMDFYVHTWNPGEPNQYGNIRTKWKALNIDPQYNPVMSDYTTYLNNFFTPILEYNKTDEKTKYISDHVWTWFNSYHIGQFLSTGQATKMMLSTGIDYDFVIRTRFDSILNPMSSSDWMTIFKDIEIQEKQDRTGIFVPWVYVRGGLPMLGDLISVSSFASWKNYAQHIEGNLFDLLTKDKLTLYPLNGEGDNGTPFITHVVWTMLGIPTNTSFFPINGAMPVNFRVCLYRREGYNKSIEESTYGELTGHYTNTEQGRNK
tara:strand:+ start:527 stop:1402 length:876 start_codon:yes stop_codon:yes gene_type:complete